MYSTRILVTGAGGFIGSSLVRELVHRGYEVRGLDNLSTGKISNLDGVLASIHFVVGDLQDTPLVSRLCEGVEVVFHEGALASVSDSVSDPLKSHRSNIEGTLSLLLAARQKGVARLVYAASSSAYGESKELPMHEGLAMAPISAYAVQKLTGEHYMQAFAHMYGMETVCLRYFNVFGPYQSANSEYSGVIANFITKMLGREQVSIFGDGCQSRDFTYIDNVVEANLLAAFAPGGKVSGNVYNAACGASQSLLEIHAILSTLLGRTQAPLFKPARRGDIRFSQADISKAEADLGYRPIVGIIEGLRRTVDWYTSNRSAESSNSDVGDLHCSRRSAWQHAVS